MIIMIIEKGKVCIHVVMWFFLVCIVWGGYHSSVLQHFQEIYSSSPAPLISLQIVQLYLEVKLSIVHIVASI